MVLNKNVKAMTDNFRIIQLDGPYLAELNNALAAYSLDVLTVARSTKALDKLKCVANRTASSVCRLEY